MTFGGKSRTCSAWGKAGSSFAACYDEPAAWSNPAATSRRPGALRARSVSRLPWGVPVPGGARMKVSSLAVIALAVICSVAEVRASNGEKPTAFGAAAGGRGGVDYAFAEDATAAQTNPAGLGFAGDRI